MKGLLIKDFRLMKNQKNFFILVFIMALFLIFTNGESASSGSFVLTYIGFISAFFAVSTISYDEYNNGYVFLFTFPFERKNYVLEKYVFGIITGLVGMAVVLICFVIYTALKNPSADIKEILFISGITIGLLFFFLSIMLPIQLKFGAEKGRIAMSITFICIFAAFYVIIKKAGAKSDKLNYIVELTDKLGIFGIMTVVILVSVIVIVISAAVSIHIMQNKEF